MFRVKDIRSMLKTKKTGTKEGVRFKDDPVDDIPSTFSNVDRKPEMPQSDFRGILQNKVNTKVGSRQDADQVDFRGVLTKKTETKVNQQFSSEQLDFRSSLMKHPETRVGVEYKSEQKDFRSVLNNAWRLGPVDQDSSFGESTDNEGAGEPGACGEPDDTLDIQVSQPTAGGEPQIVVSEDYMDELDDVPTDMKEFPSGGKDRRKSEPILQEKTDVRELKSALKKPVRRVSESM